MGKRVVVAGGGIAGVHVAKKLEAEATVILVDPKDYFEIPYAALRSTVEPSFAERSVVSYSEFLPRTDLVASAAVSASASEVTTENGERIPFDYLVVATGSTFRGPRKKQQRTQEFQSDNQRLKSANKVLVVGGGPVGVELAGEIVTDFPKKRVVLVHSGDRLLEFLGPSSSLKALKWLQSKSVQVILNDRVDTSTAKPPAYTTSKGVKIQADTHFVCTGAKVGNSWLKDGFLASKLDKAGRIDVDRHLLVTGTKNVFAAGDITNIKEIKQGFLAEKHAQTVATNIKKLLNDENARLDEYKPLAQLMGAVSLGRCNAVIQLPVVGSLAGWIPGFVKSRDLFVGKTRKGLGLAG